MGDEKLLKGVKSFLRSVLISSKDGVAAYNLQSKSNIWAASWQNQQNDCAPSEDWASAQSDQSLCCPHEGSLGP